MGNLKLQILVIVLFTVHLGYSQNNLNSFSTNQFWGDFNVSTKLSDRANFYGKLGAKTISPKVWNKLYVSSEVSYKFNNLIFKNIQRKEIIYGGVDFYFIDFIDNENAFEISPYQGYSLYWPNHRKLTLKHNAELGERFQWIKALEAYSFGLKASYELDLAYRFLRKEMEFNKGLFIGLSTKLWWNLIAANIYNDVFRITPKIGYQFNPKWKIAFFTGYNYTRSLSTDKFHTDNIIYRLRVYYKI